MLTDELTEELLTIAMFRKLSFGERRRKSLNPARDEQTDIRADGLVNPLLPVTATVLAFLLRPVTSYSMIYHTTRNAYCAYTHADTWNGFVAAPPTEDIGVLSYPFHHNNSPAYTSTRALTFARRSTTSAERYRFNFALPFALRHPLFLFLFNPPYARSSWLLYPLLLLLALPRPGLQ